MRSRRAVRPARDAISVARVKEYWLVDWFGKERQLCAHNQRSQNSFWHPGSRCKETLPLIKTLSPKICRSTLILNLGPGFRQC